MDEGPIESGLIAFVCVHTARMENPILRVTRDEPVAEQDSGWCFSCGRPGHADGDWLLVLPNRYFAADPSLTQIRGMPIKHCAERQSHDEPWLILPWEDQ